MRSLNNWLQFPVDLCRALVRFKRASCDDAVSLPRQISELILLRLGPGKLKPDDYYLMRVYRRDLKLSDKLSYVSNPAMGRIVRDRRWGVVADDKLLTYGILRSHGVSRSLQLGNGSRIAVADYARQAFQHRSGLLIQELLHPHPEIAALAGDRTCTVRMMVLYDERGPRLYRAMWKVAVAENMADNYWRQGNILCFLDAATGVVLRSTTGLGPDMREIDRHPQTGARLAGFAIPQWEALVALAMRAARTMPGLPVQARDIAPTSKGPMALEVNVFGSLFLPQVAEQSGLYQGEFRAFVEGNASKG